MSRTVLITGCSSGIGLAAAEYFARKDWNVVATLRNMRDAGASLCAANIHVVPLDVTDTSSIDNALTEGLEHFGRIDALVNNAGFSLTGPFESIPPARIEAQFAVNVTGVMNVTRALLPHFRAHKAGTIINVSSRGGIVGLPLMSLYCASKFALEGFSEALSYELAAVGIAVKIVAPGGGAATNFGKRMAAEQAQNTPIADYEAFSAEIAAASAKFATLRQGRTTTADDIARVIFTAATDGTDRLRYPVGHDIPPFIDARRKLDDDDYIAYMRKTYKTP